MLLIRVLIKRVRGMSGTNPAQKISAITVIRKDEAHRSRDVASPRGAENPITKTSLRQSLGRETCKAAEAMRAPLIRSYLHTIPCTLLCALPFLQVSLWLIMEVTFLGT